ncbi:hypothetical protein [Labilibaculum manganireducens]|uniref:Uncharacterized protein n=1 Tax=Labilibaculum manganireducens TaxID=1940525 RepID=A0A2N3ID13_9BACT|nr:hypothetical protein [Labilibaculum manganireducens]PKQ68168.1 hypothetical protein BZG01_05325 [Labilibaculum manganireducens]
MKKINFLEDPKVDQHQDKRMFPQMFNLSDTELSNLKGGILDKDVPDCDAVCLPSEHGGGTCSCLSNLC